FVRSANGTVHALESTAPLLGALDSDEFACDCGRVAFGPGDVLLAYTDGCAEACDPAGAHLGTAGVRRMLDQVASAGPSPQLWPAAMLRGVLGYRGTPVEDDTLVVAIYRPAEVEPARQSMREHLAVR